MHGYDAPAFLLISHTYTLTSGEKKRGIIGAFVPGKFRDEYGHFGNSECCLFTIMPKINFLHAYNGKGGKDFVYLNSRKIHTNNSKYKVGMGFGGEDFKDFRLWLDQELFTQSCVSSSDLTYPFGVLNEGWEETLNIE